jgi:type IV pilus assembly protein PilF
VGLIRGDLAGAGEHYARILKLDDGDVAALTKLGVVKMRAADRDEALALLRRAVERDPRNAEALLYLAGALAATGRPAEAVPYFERALSSGPRTTMALNGLGLTRLELGDRAGAAAAFQESLRLDRDQPDVARTLQDIGRP